MKVPRRVNILLALLLALTLTVSPVSVFAVSDAVSNTVSEAAPGIAQAQTQALTIEQLIQDPARSITRGEFAMLLNAYLFPAESDGVNASDSVSAGAGAGFTDVPGDHPYAADIAAAQALGYMIGDGGGIFRPDDIISGAEAAVCVNYFLGFDLAKVKPNDTTIAPEWAKTAVSNLLDLRMATLELTDKNALTVADASAFAEALLTALMFQGSPYALTQADEKDDFFAYNNRQYLATATIAPGYLFAMSFLEPQFDVEAQRAALLAEILADGGAPGSDRWKLSELYKMYVDEPGRAASLAKVMPIIDEIKAVESIAELNALAAKYYAVVDIQGFYGLAVMNDARGDATKWCVVAAPGSLMLGARDYYADTPELAPIHDELKKYLTAILAYAGETKNLESRAAAVFAMEQGNALASMPLEQLNDPEVIFAKSSWDELDKMSAGSNTMNYSPELREALKDASVYCPDADYIKHVETLYTEANLDTLKDFALLNTIGTLSPFLGDDYIVLSKDLETVMFGAPVETMSLELRAQTFATQFMNEAFSKMYADEYVTPGVKSDVTQIVESIRDKYRERITSLEWMSDGTKQKAIEKLDAIEAYVAYPDNYKTRYVFDVKAKADGGNLVEFYLDYTKSVYAQLLVEYRKPYDKNLWDDVPTYTVNAFYSPLENAIVIPAGVLQEPLYSINATRETNLGAIGAIIAHEITHAFDNSGAQYDKYGTLTNWWDDTDYAAFGELTDQVAASLSEIDFVGGQSVNGILCTGEAIADLGAMACVLDIADDEEDADLALVMRSWAHIWAARMSPEVAAYMLAVDTHAPNKVRANYTLAQFDDFYRVFGVTAGDGMYIAPENRIAIW